MVRRKRQNIWEEKGERMIVRRERRENKLERRRERIIVRRGRERDIDKGEKEMDDERIERNSGYRESGRKS